MRLIDEITDEEFSNVLFNPQLIHSKYIEKYEKRYGKELVSAFKECYHIISNNISKCKKIDDEHKIKSFKILNDGLATLTLITHSSVLGYAFQGSVLMRNYIECLGLSYGIFVNKNLFLELKENPKSKYANHFTREGLKILYLKHPELKKMWKILSEISHVTYPAVGTSILGNEMIIGGYHSKDIEFLMIGNIRRTLLMLTITSKIFREEFGLK